MESLPIRPGTCGFSIREVEPITYHALDRCATRGFGIVQRGVDPVEPRLGEGSLVYGPPLSNLRTQRWPLLAQNDRHEGEESEAKNDDGEYGSERIR